MKVVTGNKKRNIFSKTNRTSNELTQHYLYLNIQRYSVWLANALALTLSSHHFAARQRLAGRNTVRSLSTEQICQPPCQPTGGFYMLLSCHPAQFTDTTRNSCLSTLCQCKLSLQIFQVLFKEFKICRHDNQYLNSREVLSMHFTLQILCYI